jgi:hypothetical protein
MRPPNPFMNTKCDTKNIAIFFVDLYFNLFSGYIQFAYFQDTSRIYLALSSDNPPI